MHLVDYHPGREGVFNNIKSNAAFVKDGTENSAVRKKRRRNEPLIITIPASPAVVVAALTIVIACSNSVVQLGGEYFYVLPDLLTEHGNEPDLSIQDNSSSADCKLRLQFRISITVVVVLNLFARPFSIPFHPAIQSTRSSSSSSTRK